MNGFSGEIGHQVARDHIRQMQDDASRERVAAKAARSVTSEPRLPAARTARTGLGGWLRALGLAH